MIVLKAGIENVVKIAIENTIDISEFTASLTIGSLTKTITDLAAKSPEFDFSAEEVADIGTEDCYGVLQIMDADNKLYLEMRPEFRITACDSEEIDLWMQTLYITIVGDFSTIFSGGGGGDVVRKSDFEGIDKAKASVISCKATINNILDVVSS